MNYGTASGGGSGYDPREEAKLAAERRSSAAQHPMYAAALKERRHLQQMKQAELEDGQQKERTRRKSHGQSQGQGASSTSVQPPASPALPLPASNAAVDAPQPSSPLPSVGIQPASPTLDGKERSASSAAIPPSTQASAKSVSPSPAPAPAPLSEAMLNEHQKQLSPSAAAAATSDAKRGSRASGGGKTVTSGSSITANQSQRGRDSLPPTPNTPSYSAFPTPPPQHHTQQFFDAETGPADQQTAYSHVLPSIPAPSIQQQQASSLPLTALIIGPGVQGTVGRDHSSVAAPLGSAGGADHGVHASGRPSALTSFTAASGDILPRKAGQPMTNGAGPSNGSVYAHPNGVVGAHTNGAAGLTTARRKASHGSADYQSRPTELSPFSSPPIPEQLELPQQDGSAGAAGQSRPSRLALLTQPRMGMQRKTSQGNASQKSGGKSTKDTVYSGDGAGEDKEKEKAGEKRRVPLLRQLSSALSGTNLLGQPIKSNAKGKGRAQEGDPANAIEDESENDADPYRSVQKTGEIVGSPAIVDPVDEQMRSDAAIAAAMVERDLPPMPSAADPSPPVSPAPSPQPVPPVRQSAQQEPQQQQRSSHTTQAVAELRRRQSESDSSNDKKLAGALSNSNGPSQRPSAHQSHSTSSEVVKKKRSGSSGAASAGDRSSPGASGGRMGMSNIIVTASSSASSPRNATFPSAPSPTTASGKGERQPSSSMSRADRRYAEVQKALELEREKQAKEEAARAEKNRKREELASKTRKSSSSSVPKDKERESSSRRKSETDEERRRRKEVEEAWKRWDEERRKEREAGLLPPTIENRN